MDSKTLALIATILMAATMTINTTQSSSWESFKNTHGKLYGSAEEESYRQAIFMTNEAMINAHNSDKTQTYTMAVNKFADLTQAEFKSIYLGYKSTGRLASDESTVMVGDVNWVSQGAVQDVKDQGQCGSCWAFSAVASTESAKFLATGTLGDFSEQ
jgi:KDEL-tailed cysteine endopeptidase